MIKQTKQIIIKLSTNELKDIISLVMKESNKWLISASNELNEGNIKEYEIKNSVADEYYKLKERLCTKLPK